jgi:hypothetical protein
VLEAIVIQLRLPFNIVGYPFNLVHSKPQKLETPSTKTHRRYFRGTVSDFSARFAVEGLPSDVKVLLTLDCWTTLFQQTQNFIYRFHKHN